MSDRLSSLLLERCLYFTAAALARRLASLADAAFKPTGLTSSQGFALLCIDEAPGIGPGDIAAKLELAPSTITRVIDELERQGLVSTARSGKKVSATASAAGRRMVPRVKGAWRALHKEYSAVLGAAQGDALSARVHQAGQALVRAGVE